MSERRGTRSGVDGKVLRQYAISQVTRLQKDYLAETSAAKANHALLRRIDPSDEARLLLAWEPVFHNPPEELIGTGDKPSPAEQALVTAMHLYAVHQQSKSEPMHVSGVGLGAAIRKLARPDESEDHEKPVMRRYNALITATHLNEVTHHLRGLVKQMRSSGIPLDYATLTTDLFWLSHERTRAMVRLAWSRDLVRTIKKSPENDDSAASA